MKAGSSKSPEYIRVYTAYGMLAAEMVRMLLESVNIPARLLQESAGAALGLTVGTLGEVNIFVPSQYERAARETIQAMEDGRLEEPYYYTDYTQSRRYARNKQDKGDNITK